MHVHVRDGVYVVHRVWLKHDVVVRKVVRSVVRLQLAPAIASAIRSARARLTGCAVVSRPVLLAIVAAVRLSSVLVRLGPVLCAVLVARPGSAVAAVVVRLASVAAVAAGVPSFSLLPWWRSSFSRLWTSCSRACSSSRVRDIVLPATTAPATSRTGSQTACHFSCFVAVLALGGLPLRL